MSDKGVIVLTLLPLSAAILAAAYYIKDQRKKDIFFLILALICLGFHISDTYVTFFRNAIELDLYQGYVYESELIPLWFCNVMMILDLVVAGWWHKEGKLFNNVATMSAWGSVFGGFLALLYMDTSLSEWGVLQSTLSHTFLMLSGFYLFVGRYAKVGVFNVVPFSFCLAGLFLIGLLIEGLYAIIGLPSPNAMFISTGPAQIPELWGPYFIPILLGFIFLFGVVWEFIFRKKENRWYKSAADLTLYLKFKPEVEARLLHGKSAAPSAKEARTDLLERDDKKR